MASPLHDPTAIQPGWLGWLMGNEPIRQATQPASRGALLGMNYEGLPSSRNVQDIRNFPPDYPGLIRGGPDPNSDAPTAVYSPSSMGGAPGSPNMVDPSESTQMLANVPDPGSYSSSFKPNFRPRPTRLPGYGPNLPQPAYDPIWMQGVTPGMPGWQTPLSPSGPHPNRAQPQYEGEQPPIFNPNGMPIGLTLNSVPQ